MLSQQLLTCFLIGAGTMVIVALLAQLLTLVNGQLIRRRQRRRLDEER